MVSPGVRVYAGTDAYPRFFVFGLRDSVTCSKPVVLHGNFTVYRAPLALWPMSSKHQSEGSEDIFAVLSTPAIARSIFAGRAWGPGNQVSLRSKCLDRNQFTGNSVHRTRLYAQCKMQKTVVYDDHMQVLYEQDDKSGSVIIGNGHEVFDQSPVDRY